jgi:hypothetical protein
MDAPHHCTVTVTYANLTTQALSTVTTHYPDPGLAATAYYRAADSLEGLKPIGSGTRRVPVRLATTKTEDPDRPQ